jgi:hypothetical protein
MSWYLAGNEPKSALLCVVGAARPESFQAAEYQTLRELRVVKVKEADKVQSDKLLQLWKGIPRRSGKSFPNSRVFT